MSRRWSGSGAGVGCVSLDVMRHQAKGRVRHSKDGDGELHVVATHDCTGATGPLSCWISAVTCDMVRLYGPHTFWYVGAVVKLRSYTTPQPSGASRLFPRSPSALCFLVSQRLHGGGSHQQTPSHPQTAAGLSPGLTRAWAFPI